MSPQSPSLHDDYSFVQAAPPHHNSNTPPSTNASHTPPGPHGGPALNPRSCVICRRRKVRCNKTYPCSNCAKAKVQCIFPAPERAKRRPRKPPDGELMTRLRRLEGVIQGMGMSVEDELAASGDGLQSPEQKPLPQLAPGALKSASSQHLSDMDPATTPTARLGTDFGRLVVSEGKSRYVNNRFWATLTNEIEDLKGILDETSDEDGDLPSPSTDPASPPPDAAFFFNYSSLAHDLHSFHPAPELIWELWEIYKQYNDPVIKMIHVPSMEKQVQAVMQNPGKSSKPLEAFLFAVYFASVTALTPDDCTSKFGESRDALVRRYKFGVEQALARANFLISEEMLVLQSLMTYLVCLRCHEDGRLLWSLNGVAVRLAISMGLQRDGSNFNISPFETEMRRRVWWQLVALEWRGSQDAGIEPIILSSGYDTRLPLNVNDADLSPDMTEFPTPGKGLTDMTFCILRYDLQRSLQKLFAPGATLHEKERAITSAHQHLEDDYFKYCDMSKPLDWTICTVAKLIMARQFLVLYHPHLKSLPQVTIDRLFVTALDTIEFALRLETERKMVKWGWLFKTYNQWHALAFLLSELTRRTRGPLVQRAWRAVNSTLAEFRVQYHENKRGQLWRPVVKLLHTARAARERELAMEAANYPRALSNNELQQQIALTDRDMMPMGFAPDGGAIGRDVDNYALKGSNNSDNSVNMTMLEPSISAQSNSIDDQYLFDNTSNSVPFTSQFFANTPGVWQDVGSNTNTNTSNNNNSITNLQGQAGMSATPMNGDWFGDWADQQNLPQLDPSVLNTFAMGQQGYGGMESMGGGSESYPGTDWEEVMREFDAEGQPTQWNKPALMGETWL